MDNNKQVTQEKFPYDPAHPFRHMGRAMRHGINSREWNQFLSSLTPIERRQAVSSVRGASVFERPACYWPPQSTHQRYSMAGVR